MSGKSGFFIPVARTEKKAYVFTHHIRKETDDLSDLKSIFTNCMNGVKFDNIMGKELELRLQVTCYEGPGMQLNIPVSNLYTYGDWQKVKSSFLTSFTMLIDESEVVQRSFDPNSESSSSCLPETSASLIQILMQKVVVGLFRSQIMQCPDAITEHPESEIERIRSMQHPHDLTEESDTGVTTIEVLTANVIGAMANVAVYSAGQILRDDYNPSANIRNISVDENRMLNRLTLNTVDQILRDEQNSANRRAVNENSSSDADQNPQPESNTVSSANVASALLNPNGENMITEG